MDINEISGVIVDAAIEVHNELGPGLIEKTYQQCLYHELTERKLKVVQEVGLPVRYKGILIDLGYRIDLLVENHVVVELKAVRELLPIHKAQVYTYIKLSKKPLGLLINFNTRLLKNGITRVINFTAENSDITFHSGKEPKTNNIT